MPTFRERLASYGDLYRYVTAAVLINLPLIALILALNLRDAGTSPLTWTYAIATMVGYYGLPLLVVATALFLVLMPFRRAALFATGTVLTLWVFYLLLDALVYSVYKFHIDFFWLEYLINDFQGLGIDGAQVATGVAGFVAVVALEIGIFATARRIKHRRAVLVYPLVVVLALVGSQLTHIFAYAKNDMRITAVTPHFPFYLPTTSHSSAKKYGDMVPLEETIASVEADGAAGALTFPLAPIELDPTAGGENGTPNVLMILLESWRFDTMNAEVSPRIREFSERSTVFLDHYSSGNSTVAGIFGMYYGINPTYWAAVKANAAAIDNPPLIDIMEDRGYEFGIYAKSRFDRHKIADTVFRGHTIVNDFEGRSHDLQDIDLADRVLGFLDRKAAEDKPFYALAFFKSTHFNYSYDEASAKFRPSVKLNMALAANGKDPELYLNDYRNAVFFNDRLVGRIIDKLDETGLSENTVVIITTDHGEAFNDNGENYWGHGSNFTQYQTKVPMIVYRPDAEPRTVATATSHIDIAPSLMQQYLGCTNDIADYSDGINFFTQARDERVLVISSYFNHAFIVGDNVYAIYPLHTRKYLIDDVSADAESPPVEVLRRLMTDITRFYAPDSQASLGAFGAIPSL